MKKLFVAVLALAALAACNKEEAPQGPALDSQNKTIEITIDNARLGSRADYESGVTAPGTKDKVANASELIVLFADNSGKILKALELTATGATDDTHDNKDQDTLGEYIADKANGTGEGDYVWHNVPWNVTKIALVRVDATLDGDYVVANAAGKNISDYKDLAMNVAENANRAQGQIVLFGTGDLSDSGETHRVNDTVFHVWETTVTVEPWLARFEVHALQCTDLGEDNKDTLEDGTTPNLSTYGFDELVVKSLIWKDTNSNTYNAKEFETVLYGSYAPAAAKDGCDPLPAPGTARNNYYTADGGLVTADRTQVWSWYVADKTEFDNLVVDMDAKAYEYAIADDQRNVPLTVIDLATDKDGNNKANTFTRGHIYTISLIFDESNIKNADALCVRVDVKIASWEIDPLFPVYNK
ncbi:MAG: hypothetical protein IKB24_00480 [Alistipes sp.]|nr:hypothetical protein [Alistipes sp.]